MEAALRILSMLRKLIPQECKMYYTHGWRQLMRARHCAQRYSNQAAGLQNTHKCLKWVMVPNGKVTKLWRIRRCGLSIFSHEPKKAAGLGGRKMKNKTNCGMTLMPPLQVCFINADFLKTRSLWMHNNTMLHHNTFFPPNWFCHAAFASYSSVQGTLWRWQNFSAFPDAKQAFRHPRLTSSPLA